LVCLLSFIDRVAQGRCRPISDNPGLEFVAPKLSVRQKRHTRSGFLCGGHTSIGARHGD